MLANTTDKGDLMKRSLPLVGLAALMLLAGPVATPVLATSADTQTEMKATEAKTDELLSAIADANADVIKLNDQITKKNADLKAVQADIKDSQAKLDTLASDIKQATKEVAARKANLRDQLVSLQKQADNSVTGNVYLDFVLNAKDLSDLVSRTVTVSKLSTASKEALDAVDAAKAKLDGLKQEEAKKHAQLEADSAKLSEEKAALVDLKQQAKTKSDQLNKKIQANKATLDALQEKFEKQTAAEAKAAAEKLAKEQAAAKAAAEAKAKAAAKAATKVTATEIDVVGGNHADNTGSGNTYPWGQCTWYVKARAPWVGNMWGNGNMWGGSAAAAGFTVNNRPATGSVVSFAAGQMIGTWAADPSYGHVAYVESYDAASDTITISQGGMGFSNPAGPNTQTVSGASAFTYIHR